MASTGSTAGGTIIYASPKKKKRDDGKEEDDWNDICTIQWVWSTCTVCFLASGDSKDCVATVKWDCAKLSSDGKGGFFLDGKPDEPTEYHPDPTAPVPGVVPPKPDGTRSDSPSMNEAFVADLVPRSIDHLAKGNRVPPGTKKFVGAVVTVCTFFSAFWILISKTAQGAVNCKIIGLTEWYTIWQFYFDFVDKSMKLRRVESAIGAKQPASSGGGWSGKTQADTDSDETQHKSTASPTEFCAAVQSGKAMHASPDSK